jgi:hypothetical protein
MTPVAVNILAPQCLSAFRHAFRMHAHDERISGQTWSPNIFIDAFCPRDCLIGFLIENVHNCRALTGNVYAKMAGTITIDV